MTDFIWDRFRSVVTIGGILFCLRLFVASFVGLDMWSERAA